MLLFAFDDTRAFADSIGRALGTPLSPLELRQFEDGEHKARPMVEVAGAHAVLVQSLHSDKESSANDKLCRFLFLAGCLRDCGAARVSAVIPYLAYARKDRRTKARDPLTLRYVAQLIEAVGIETVIVLEAHNRAAFENAFRIRTVFLDPYKLYTDSLVPLLREGPVTVVSPDLGGAKRAQLFRETLEAGLGRSVGLAYVEKRRSAGVVSGDMLIGELEGATALIIDDLISTGGTVLRAARKCQEAGAQRVLACAAHGLFVPPAGDVVQDPVLEKTLVTDCVPPFRLNPNLIGTRIEVLPAGPVFADALRHLF